MARYVAFTSNDGFTVLNARDPFPEACPVYVLAPDGCFARRAFVEGEVRELIKERGGYLIKSKLAIGEHVVNAETDVEQFSVKGVQRSFEIYVHNTFSAITYVDSEFSRIYVHDDVAMDSADPYFLDLGNLMPWVYISTELNAACGAPPHKMLCLNGFSVQELDLDYVSGVSASFYALKNMQLLGAWDLHAQTCSMLPLPTNERSVDAAADIVCGKSHMTVSVDGQLYEEQMLPVLSLEQVEGGVMFDENVRIQSKKLVDDMRRGFYDPASDEFVQMDLSWAKQYFKPTHAALGKEGTLLYLFKNREQMRAASQGSEVLSPDGYVYRLENHAATSLNADLLAAISGQEVLNYYGLLVNAGVNTILQEAISIYNAAKTKTYETFADMLYECYTDMAAGTQEYCEGVVKELLTAAAVECQVDGVSVANMLGSTKPDREIKLFGTVIRTENFRNTPQEIDFKSGSKFTLFPVDAPGDFGTDLAAAKLYMEELLAVVGTACQKNRLAPEDPMVAKIITDAFSTLPPGIINDGDVQKFFSHPIDVLSAKWNYGAEDPRSVIIRDRMKGELGVLFQGPLAQIATSIGNLLNYVGNTPFTGWRNNTAKYRKSCLFCSQQYSTNIMPDPYRIGMQNIAVENISVVGKGSEFKVTVDMAIDTGVHTYRQGLVDAGAVAHRMMEAMCESATRPIKDGGFGQRLTMTYLGGRGDDDYATQGWPATTSLPFDAGFLKHMRSNRRASGNQNQVGTARVGLRACFTLARNVALDDVVVRCSDEQSRALASGIVDQSASGVAALPFVVFLMHHAEALQHVQDMNPVGFVDNTYLDPVAMKAFYEVSWADGDVLAQAIGTAEVALAAMGIPSEEVQDGINILKKIQSDVHGALSRPVQPVYWFTESALASCEGVGNLGTVPLYIDYGV